MQPVEELILELSHNCDLACVMCGFGGSKVTAERFMAPEVVTKVLDAFDDLPGAIRLNGRGESTIHPRFVEILRAVRERAPDAQINLFSHLSGTKEAVIDALIECRVQLFISMDSANPQRLVSIRRRSKFESIERNIARLGVLEPRPFLVFTLQELNLADLVPIAELAITHRLHLIVNTVRRDEGIEVFQRLVAEHVDEIRESMDRIEELYEATSLTCLLPDQVQGIRVRPQAPATTYGSRDACPAVQRELCVLFDGTVTPCNMFNPYEYGNLLEEGLVAIRSGPRFRWFEENHKEHYYCANCACLGGTR